MQCKALTRSSSWAEIKVTTDLPLDKNTSEDRIRISPLAKRLALKNNISYEGIKGSGPYGRIVKKDIESNKIFLLYVLLFMANNKNLLQLVTGTTIIIIIINNKIIKKY